MLPELVRVDVGIHVEVGVHIQAHVGILVQVGILHVGVQVGVSLCSQCLALAHAIPWAVLFVVLANRGYVFWRARLVAPWRAVIARQLLGTLHLPWALVPDTLFHRLVHPNDVGTIAGGCERLDAHVGRYLDSTVESTPTMFNELCDLPDWHGATHIEPLGANSVNVCCVEVIEALDIDSINLRCVKLPCWGGGHSPEEHSRRRKHYRILRLHLVGSNF